MLNNVINNKKDIFVCDNDFLKNLKKRAQVAKNRRSRVCIHLSRSSQVQEMIIYALKDSYMPPHKHPTGNSETYHLISGKLDLYLFNKSGHVIKKISLEAHNKKSKKNFYYRTNSGDFWHMPVVKSRECVFHEIYSGPWKKQHDVKFPKWAPSLDDSNLHKIFLSKLSKRKL
tara:strand:- start:1035 stop:1550 length:516 start_codon:yes stop_codon:yes gene_type:complete